MAIHFADATLSGASVNPARSIGSAVVGGDLTSLWIYLVGPIVGGIIGWGIWRASTRGATRQRSRGLRLTTGVTADGRRRGPSAALRRRTARQRSSRLNRRALPIWPQTRAWVTASIWRMWLRS